MEQKSNELTNNRRIRKVAILGAGASADAGAPIINDFWTKVEELIKENKFNPQEIEKFKKVLEKKQKLLPNSDIEKFFSYVDFQAEFDVLISTPSFARNISYKIFNKKYENCIPILSDTHHIGNEKKDFIKLKEDISFLISRTLDETLKNTPNLIENCYKKLIENFDVTISFNWDILYEHSYKNFKRESIPTNQLGFSKAMLCKPALLKLHGSLSWGKCKKCGLYMSDSKIEHLIYGKNMICPNCNENILRPTSILPALTKFETIAKTKYPPFRDIWYCATHAITEAEEIYFFGYSLSNNDIHTKIFFENGIRNNINSNLKIFVIDKNCSEELKDRYNKSFENKVKPIFIKKSFKDYLSSIS